MLGVSGGVDSMVLAEAVRRTALVGPGDPVCMPVVAHVNYGLRPGADADTELVTSWCATHRIPCHVLRVPEQSHVAPPAGSPQAWARDVRYRFFLDVAAKEGAVVVLVAHHADDQAETVALEGGRAAGPGGLMGMVPRRALRTVEGQRAGVDLVRPFLRVDRAHIEQAAMEWNVPWRMDPSNEHRKYARVRVRQDMDASGKHFWLAVSDAATKTVREWEDALPAGLRSALDAAHAAAGDVFIPETAWNAGRSAVRPWFVLRLLKELDGRAPRRRSTIEAVEALWDAQSGSRVETGAVVWTREREGVVVHASGNRPDQEGCADYKTPVPCHIPADGDEPASFRCAGGTLEIHSPSPPPHDPEVPDREVWLDAAALEGPLEVRPWRAGDRFHPLGAPGTRKVKSFLTDARVPSSTRKRVLVLTSGGAIVWIVGLRPSHDARIRPGTARAVHLAWIAPDTQG